MVSSYLWNCWLDTKIAPIQHIYSTWSQLPSNLLCLIAISFNPHPRWTLRATTTSLKCASHTTSVYSAPALSEHLAPPPLETPPLMSPYRDPGPSTVSPKCTWNSSGRWVHSSSLVVYIDTLHVCILCLLRDCVQCWYILYCLLYLLCKYDP